MCIHFEIFLNPQLPIMSFHVTNYMKYVIWPVSYVIHSPIILQLYLFLGCVTQADIYSLY